MSDELDRIINAKNSVGKGFGPGKNIPYALKTKETSAYRVTGMDQIEDIVNCGYVRPKGYGIRSEKVGNVIYWSIGGENLYYHDGRPVLEVPTDKVKDGQMGAIPIEDLNAIWTFDNNQEKYVNNLDYFKSLYYDLHSEMKTDKSR